MLNADWSADVPTLLLTVPEKLWRLYVDHLWNFQPGSWVTRAASTFQFLAYLIITPFALLTLLVSFHCYLLWINLGSNASIQRLDPFCASRLIALFSFFYRLSSEFLSFSRLPLNSRIWRGFSRAGCDVIHDSAHTWCRRNYKGFDC